MQACLGADSPDKGNLFAITRGRRTTGPAWAGDVVLGLARFEIKPFDDVDLFVRILVVFKDIARRGVLRVIEVLPIA